MLFRSLPLTMSFDPRSRERLQALGRSLPQKLPAPASAAPAPERGADGGRHRLETEQDPEALFRELINASSDGSVPPHLLDRLRELEGRRPRQPRPEAAAPSDPGAASSRAGGPAVRAAGATRSPQRPGPQPPRRPRLDPEQQALYCAFHDLLLDEDSDA